MSLEDNKQRTAITDVEINKKTEQNKIRCQVYDVRRYARMTVPLSAITMSPSERCAQTSPTPSAQDIIGRMLVECHANYVRGTLQRRRVQQAAYYPRASTYSIERLLAVRTYCDPSYSSKRLLTVRTYCNPSNSSKRPLNPDLQ